MSDARQAQMDAAQCYCEETFTDRRVGTIKRLTPVDSEGKPDATRAVVYVGQAQVMTPMGAIPLSFDIEAPSLSQAIAGFGAAAETAVAQTMRELQELRRESASSLVIPDAAGAAMPNSSELLSRGGRPRR